MHFIGVCYSKWLLMCENNILSLHTVDFCHNVWILWKWFFKFKKQILSAYHLKPLFVLKDINKTTKYIFLPNNPP